MVHQRHNSRAETQPTERPPLPVVQGAVMSLLHGIAQSEGRPTERALLSPRRSVFPTPAFASTSAPTPHPGLARLFDDPNDDMLSSAPPEDALQRIALGLAEFVEPPTHIEADVDSDDDLDERSVLDETDAAFGRSDSPLFDGLAEDLSGK